MYLHTLIGSPLESYTSIYSINTHTHTDGYQIRRKSGSVVLSDHLYPIRNHYYPDACGHFQNDITLIQRSREVTEWFDE